MHEVWFQATENCNLKCGHCAYNFGPGGETASEDTVEAVVEALPKDTFSFSLTGGEIFTRKQILVHALAYAAVMREERFPNAKLALQTNGYWVDNPEETFERMRTLFELGLDFLCFSGNDKYHEEHDIDTSKLRFDPKIIADSVRNSSNSTSILETAYLKMLATYGIDSFPSSFYVLSSGIDKGVYPVGRAKHLPSEELNMHSVCDITRNQTNGRSELLVDVRGDVHMCIWKIPPPIGSVHDAPIDVLVEDAMKKPIYSILALGGPEMLAKVFGLYEQSDIQDMFYRFSPCYMCEQVFAKLAEKS